MLQIRKRFRSALSNAGPDDFVELDEMLVELKLMITKKFLNCVGIPTKISLLCDALSRYTGELSDECEDEECEEEVDSE